MIELHSVDGDELNVTPNVLHRFTADPAGTPLESPDGVYPSESLYPSTSLYPKA